MMKRMRWAGLALGWAAGAALGAGPLQDWTHSQLGNSVGDYADKAGSVLTASLEEGPAAGQRALRLKGTVVQWAGAWSLVEPLALAHAGGLRFQARSEAPTLLSVMLVDSHKLQVEHVVRLQGGAWQDFSLPLTSFRPSSYQDPKAPKGGRFDPSVLQAMNLSPQGAGRCDVTVGPVEAVAGKVELRDGSMPAGVAQDFIGLESSAFGPFADTKGSSIKMEVGTGAPESSGPAAHVSYHLAAGGWCGEWIRAGADWTGQDWSGATALALEVYTTEPLGLQMAFNDGAQNAYTADAAATQGGRWETVLLPLKSFSLNPYYQPPQAKKGAALDLSHIETFNICPRSEGKHQFWLRAVKVIREP